MSTFFEKLYAPLGFTRMSVYVSPEFRYEGLDLYPGDGYRWETDEELKARIKKAIDER